MRSVHTPVRDTGATSNASRRSNGDGVGVTPRGNATTPHRLTGDGHFAFGAAAGHLGQNPAVERAGIRDTENKEPHKPERLTGFFCRAHNRDRTGDLILTKDVLYRLSYVSGLRTALAIPKNHACRLTISVDEFRVIGNPLHMSRYAAYWPKSPSLTCLASEAPGPDGTDPASRHH